MLISLFFSSLTHPATAIDRCDMLYIDSLREYMTAREIEFMWRINALVCCFGIHLVLVHTKCKFSRTWKHYIIFSQLQKREKSLFAKRFQETWIQNTICCILILLKLITICKRKYGVKVWNGSFSSSPYAWRERTKRVRLKWHKWWENEIHYYFEWHKLHKMTKRDWICCLHHSFYTW